MASLYGQKRFKGVKLDPLTIEKLNKENKSEFREESENSAEWVFNKDTTQITCKFKEPGKKVIKEQLSVVSIAPDNDPKAFSIAVKDEAGKIYVLVFWRDGSMVVKQEEDGYVLYSGN